MLTNLVFKSTPGDAKPPRMKKFFATLLIFTLSAAPLAQASETPFDEETPAAPQPSSIQPTEEIRASQAPTPEAAPSTPSTSQASATPEAPAGPVSLTRPNAFSIELLGRAGVWAFTYDRSLTSWLGLGVGISYLWASLFSAWVGALVFPVFANFYILPDSHRPFLTVGTDFALGGAGYVSMYDDSAHTAVNVMGFNNFHVGFGYEYRSQSGFVLRIAPYLMVLNLGDSRWLVGPTIGLSLGGTK